MRHYILDCFAVVRAVAAASRSSARRRFVLGFAELSHFIIFYIAHGTIIFNAFKVVNGRDVPRTALVAFFLIMCSVDSSGEALYFRGVTEYCRALRRRNYSYYALAPGLPIAKALFLRVDLPLIALGSVLGLAGTVFATWEFGTNPLLTVFAIVFGIVVHVILSSAFLIIQAGFDPTLPLNIHSPTIRYYTKPLHLILTGGLTSWLLSTIFPVYYMTAFPAAIATRLTSWDFDHNVLTGVGLSTAVIWLIGLNYWVLASVRKWS